MKYRVRYRFCPVEDYIARMQPEAEEKVRLHQGLYHHDDGKQCAHYEELSQTQANKHEAAQS